MGAAGNLPAQELEVVVVLGVVLVAVDRMAASVAGRTSMVPVACISMHNTPVEAVVGALTPRELTQGMADAVVG